MEGNRPKLMFLAMAMMGAVAPHEREASYALKAQLDNAYRFTVRGHRSTNAAAQKRAARKRRNIRARASKRG